MVKHLGSQWGQSGVKEGENYRGDIRPKRDYIQEGPADSKATPETMAPKWDTGPCHVTHPPPPVSFFQFCMKLTFFLRDQPLYIRNPSLSCPYRKGRALFQAPSLETHMKAPQQSSRPLCLLLVGKEPFRMA